MFHSASLLGFLSVKLCTTMLPGTSTAPAMATMPAIFGFNSGAAFSTSAMVVIAPIDRIDTGSGEARSVSAISRAESGKGLPSTPAGRGGGKPIMPSAPARHSGG